MNRLKYVFMLIGLRIALAMFFTSGTHVTTNAPASAAAAPAATAEPSTGGAGPWSKTPPATALTAAAFYHHPQAPSGPVTLARDGSGHFNITASVNGHPASFVIDTGADLVSIPAEQAAAMGITVNPSDFQPILRTASGTGMGARVHLDRLEVAGVDLHDVDAVVAQGLDVSLLGQSALRKLGNVSLNGDTMTIAPN